MKLSLLQSLLSPLKAMVHAQRSLARSALERLRVRMRPTGRGYEPDPILFVVPFPRPELQRLQLQVPASSLRPASNLTLARARAEWSWSLDQAASRGGPTQPATLLGRMVAPIPRRRRPARNGVFAVALTLRRLEPTEGMQRLQQALGRARLDAIPKERIR